MKAILVNDDRSLRWDNVPDPILGEDDCLVKIEAAALNRADLMQREGDYPPPAGCPKWMGLEIAGTIVEIADGAKEKSNWKIGDKVCALLGGGGYAQYANVKYDMLMPVPLIILKSLRQQVLKMNILLRLRTELKSNLII